MANNKFGTNSSASNSTPTPWWATKVYLPLDPASPAAARRREEKLAKQLEKSGEVVENLEALIEEDFAKLEGTPAAPHSDTWSKARAGEEWLYQREATAARREAKEGRKRQQSHEKEQEEIQKLLALPYIGGVDEELEALKTHVSEQKPLTNHEALIVSQILEYRAKEEEYLSRYQKTGEAYLLENAATCSDYAEKQEAKLAKQ